MSKVSGMSLAQQISQRQRSGLPISARESGLLESYRERDRLYQRKWRAKHRAQVLVRHAKRRAEKSGIPFDLDDHRNQLQERIDAGHCELTGIPFTTDIPRSYDSPSLDRIDPDKGYLYSNIRVICLLMNQALGHWGEKPLRQVMEHWLEK